MKLGPLLAVLLLSSCMDRPGPTPQAPPPVVLPAAYLWLSPDDAVEFLQLTPNVGVLDVRDDHEIRSGTGWIVGAQPCSYLQGNSEKLASLDRHRPWFVYCALGGRSELTAQAMAQLGFEKVYLLQGGFVEWRALNKPVVK